MAKRRVQHYGDAGADATVDKPDIKLPPGYDSEDVFLSEMRTMFYDDYMYDELNRSAAIEDLLFEAGDQWDTATKARRIAQRKPLLTVNRLPAFIAQIIGSRRLNETDVKVAADDDSFTAKAKIREDILRQIQKASDADTAYDNALHGAAACGIGNFRVDLDYCDDDALGNQDIIIGQIQDPLAVVWDRKSIDPTGADAGHAFVIESITRKEFYTRWPWATPADMATAVFVNTGYAMEDWITIHDVRIVEYWAMRSRTRTIAMLNDGTTVDITGVDDPSILANIAVKASDGSPVIRKVQRRYAQRYLCSACDILEGPYELPISRVPLFRVPGWDIKVGERRMRWGLVRFLKDPQRIHNYVRSVTMERMQLTPRGNWVGPLNAFTGREAQWRESHISDDPLLMYNSEAATPPVRIPPVQLEEALMSYGEVSSQDMKDVSNIHEAALGMPSNEVSYLALAARQRISDTGTIIYHDNLAKAIAQAGYTMNELIPVVYDTDRVVRAVGEDGKTYSAALTSFGTPGAIDIGSGKYDVTCGVGPSYATKRIEAAASILGLSQSMPQILSVAADLIVEAQDWPKSDEIAARLRAAMPPNILQPNEMSPQQQAQAQGAAQQQAKTQAAQEQMLDANYLKTQTEAMLNAARARDYAARAAAVPAHTNVEMIRAAADATHMEVQNRLDALRIGQDGSK